MEMADIGLFRAKPVRQDRGRHTLWLDFHSTGPRGLDVPGAWQAGPLGSARSSYGDPIERARAGWLAFDRGASRQEPSVLKLMGSLY